jgi:surface protein
MSHMFCEAKSFNQDISNWDVGNVTYMNSMLREAKWFIHNYLIYLFITIIIKTFYYH